MDKYIDRTIINLVTLLISGTGLLLIIVQTKFNVPELSKTFYDKNLFSVKHNIIVVVNIRIFTLLTAIGLLIQAYPLIWDHDIPDRMYGALTYVVVFVSGLLVMCIVVFLLKKLGNIISRKYWLPEIVENLREASDKAISIVELYDRKDDLIERKDIHEKNKKTDLAKVEEIFTHIESLFDIPHDKTDLGKRLDRLRNYFK